MLTKPFLGVRLANAVVTNQGGILSKSEETPLGITSGERRLDKRLLINAQVEIEGVDSAGRPFTERTSVRNFNDEGCDFRMQIPLRCGGTVAIKPLGSDGQISPHEPSKLFEIMWVARSITGWTVGVRALRDAKNANRETDGANQSSGGSPK